MAYYSNSYGSGGQYYQTPARYRKAQRESSGCLSGCGGCVLLPALLILTLLIVYLFLPFATRVIVLGIDEAPPGTFLGRSDTIMLINAKPMPPKLAIVSIPRDLWVPLGAYGENRINTAHFFAESASTGAGPIVARDTINSLFQTNINYYVRFSFNSVIAVVDSIGGVEITLDAPQGGLNAGTHQLNGAQALDFVRERKSADDFARMRHGQMFISAFMRKLLSPATLPQYPAFIQAMREAIDTNIPIWHWPRLATLFTLGFLTETDSSTIDRTMVTPFTTSGGASVLLPDWNQILPFVHQRID